MKHLLLVSVGLLCLAGCRMRSVPIVGWFFGGPDKPQAGAPPGPDKTPSGGGEPHLDSLMELALWATWAGALAWVIAVPIFMWVSRPIAIRIAVSGLGLIVSSQILIWVGDHLAWLSAIVLIVTLAIACWKYRKTIIDQAECLTGKDLDGKPNTTCPGDAV